MCSSHEATDNRVFHKECRSLVDAGYDVTLIAPATADETVGGVHIQSIPPSANRFLRMTQTVWRVYRLALRQDADIYHFHDPELLPVGMLLKWRGKLVVYDVHEDVPRQILNKYWLPAWSRGILAKAVERFELWVTKRLDAMVCATPTIAKRFCPQKAITVYNYPWIDVKSSASPVPYADRPAKVAYVGGIAPMRGIHEMMEAMALLPKSLDTRLIAGGPFFPPELKEELSVHPGCDRTDFVGELTRQEVVNLLAECRIGLVTLHPIPNYLDALPVKLFEYMSAGIPVIASDFPLWRQIVESAQCGLLVDPLNPQAIADAIQWLLEHPDEAAQMGQCGREAVVARYDWRWEAKKLDSLYQRLLTNQSLGIA
ncbi:MAG: glycosyltransferase family 4 protein [Planctomycetaceae bacterium]|nr:glycosyltransferase family 4 protein [Planctomycetaceae bacterium]